MRDNNNAILFFKFKSKQIYTKSEVRQLQFKVLAHT